VAEGSEEIADTDESTFAELITQVKEEVASDEEELCVECGEIKGSEACCVAEEQEVCDSCGMTKGSPECCIDVEK
ncbi:hypothetical protein ACFL3D_07085, partial [Candidatus Omnitrophota bacterium]